MVGKQFDPFESMMLVGMDEKNERRIWDMLLKVCRDHQVSQNI
jgi:hypothetical protein